MADAISVIMHGFLGVFEEKAAQRKSAKEKHVYLFKGEVLCENGKPIK